MNITTEAYNKFLADNKLDFDVEMMPQFIDTPEGRIQAGFCPVRTDNWANLSNGGLSKGFTPIQNRDAFSVIPELSNVRDISMVNGMQWNGGAGVCAQISLGHMTVDNSEDKVHKYLSVINSHDGSHALNILITPFRQFCRNQITAMIKEARQANESRIITIRHTASAQDKLEELIRTVKIADEVFEHTAEVYHTMAQTGVNPNDIEDILDEVLNKVYPKLEDEGPRAVKNREDRKKAAKWRFRQADAGRIAMGTAWNLYNAIQGTIQHDSRDTAGKRKSILMGNIADKSRDTLKAVLEVTNSQRIIVPA